MAQYNYFYSADYRCRAQCVTMRRAMNVEQNAEVFRTRWMIDNRPSRMTGFVWLEAKTIVRLAWGIIQVNAASAFWSLHQIQVSGNLSGGQSWQCHLSVRLPGGVVIRSTQQYMPELPPARPGFESHPGRHADWVSNGSPLNSLGLTKTQLEKFFCSSSDKSHPC